MEPIFYGLDAQVSAENRMVVRIGKKKFDKFKKLYTVNPSCVVPPSMQASLTRNHMDPWATTYEDLQSYDENPTPLRTLYGAVDWENQAKRVLEGL